MARFTATHGVNFADLDITFTYDREATGTNASKVYAADLDASQAKALKALSKDVLAEYGITEAKSSDND